MDLFTYLMAKNGNNTSVHGDLFSYLLGKGQSQTQTISGVTIYIPNAKKLVSFMMTKESTQETTTGKQLFDKDNAIYVNRLAYRDDFTAFQETSSTSPVRVYYLQCESNTTYTYSKLLGTYCRFGSCINVPANNVPITVLNNDSAAQFATITTGANDNYIFFSPLKSSELDTYDFDDVIATVQIELGSTATEYEEYTGEQPSPNPDYPQEVNTVKGYSNLFNANLMQARTHREVTLTINDGILHVKGTSTCF